MSYNNQIIYFNEDRNISTFEEYMENQEGQINLNMTSRKNILNFFGSEKPNKGRLSKTQRKNIMQFTLNYWVDRVEQLEDNLYKLYYGNHSYYGDPCILRNKEGGLGTYKFKVKDGFINMDGGANTPEFSIVGGGEPRRLINIEVMEDDKKEILTQGEKNFQLMRKLLRCKNNKQRRKILKC